MKDGMNRRSFLKTGSVATAGTFISGGLKTHLLAEAQEPAAPARSANDQIQIALIGAGGQGMGDTKTAIQVPGVKLVAVADCYDGRLAHSKELWGDDVFTTREYHEVLARKDIDAVIIGTPDHWHRQVAVDAMNAGKDVYCEKPMIHAHSEGMDFVNTAKKTQRIIQIGSQRVSSITYKKAREIVQSGKLGQITAISAWWDRNSSLGAWNYSIAPDASEQTIDWPRFLGNAPKIPFNPEHFFQWRKWRAYGTGVAGDLFVHLFSGIHFVTQVNGPQRAFATGGIRFWKDGRDAADVLLGLFDYPQGFNLSLRVNFACGGSESEGFVFNGSEGSMVIGENEVTLNHVPREREPGYTIDTFTQDMQEKFLAEYLKKYPRTHPDEPPYAAEEKYAAPEGYSDSYDHLKNFFASVRSRRPVVEDAVFGFRAAGAALLNNLSMDSGKPVRWDPDGMKLL
jgi:predicted dehydrogenase